MRISYKLLPLVIDFTKILFYCLHIVNCAWDDWSSWSSCSITCGTGTKSRSRVIKTHEENGGTACTGDSSEISQLSCGTCPAGKIYTNFHSVVVKSNPLAKILLYFPHLVNCAWDDWSSWSSCSMTCGTGTKTRTRVIKTYEENGGSACTGDSSEIAQLSCGICPTGKVNINLYSVLSINTSKFTLSASSIVK